MIHTYFVYELQRELIDLIKFKYPHIEKIEYFSNGCAGQYKSFKNMLNLCLHKTIFGLEANLTFLLLVMGNLPVRCIGGTVKRLTARTSLQRQHSSQTLTVASMLEFCQENLKDIKFCYLPKNKLQTVREELKSRFSKGRTIPGTRSYHFFAPSSDQEICYKRTSEDAEFSGKFSITGKAMSYEKIRYNAKVHDYVACLYDEKMVGWFGSGG